MTNEKEGAQMMFSKPISFCAVRDCLNSKHLNKIDTKTGELITYHRFPKAHLLLTKWMSFCQHPDFNIDVVSKKQLLSKISSRRYVICSCHFDKPDYKIWKDGKRHLEAGAVPRLYGSTVTDTSGNELSPIKPMSKEAARLQGLPVVNLQQNADNSRVDLGDQDLSVEGNISDLNSSTECTNMDGNEVVGEASDTLQKAQDARITPADKSTRDQMLRNILPTTAKKRRKKKAAPPSFPHMSREEIMTNLFEDKTRRLKYVSPSPTSYRLQARVKQLSKTVQQLKARKMTRAQCKTVALKYINAALNPVQAAFLTSIIQNASKRPRGRRYNKEAKAIAMSLFLFDPRAYKNLRELLKALPSPSLLRKMLDNNPVEEGFMPFVFEALKFATCQFDDRSKYVSLSWDGINLSPGLHYVEQNNKEGKGSIDGFIGGLDQATKEPASEAVVLMVRSIFGDFKQPLAYFNFDPHFTASKLEPIINKAIDELQKCGLVVKTLVCDQAGAHQSLYNSIFHVSPEKPFIERNNCKIYCMFDPPHLLKSFKANLKLRVATVGDKPGVVTWKYIIDFYEADCKNLTRIAPKLTDNHVYGKPVTNMNVPMAAQIFSKTVAGGIKEYVKLGILPPEALATAEVCELLNDLFDSCNSRLKDGEKITLDAGQFPENVRDFVPPLPNEFDETLDSLSKDDQLGPIPTTRNPYLEPLSDTSLHLKLWERAEEYIKSVKFFREDSGGFSRPPCLKGWLLTISALRSLWLEMRSLGIQKMPTKYLNQDFVENFFSQVRYRNGHSQVTCKEFRIIFKFLLHQHIMDPSRGKNTNCSIDGGKFLFLMQDAVHKKLLTDLKKKRSLEEQDMLNNCEPDLSADVPVLDVSDDIPIEFSAEDYIVEDHPGDVKFSSYLARRIVLFSNDCILCKCIYTSEAKQTQHSILENTESNESRYQFIASSKAMQIFVHHAVARFDSTLKSSYGEKHLGQLIAAAVRSCKGFSLLTSCSVHHETIPPFFLQTFIRAMMRYRMKLQKDGLSAYIVSARQRFKKASLASSSAKHTKLFCLDNLDAPNHSRKPKKKKKEISAIILESKKKFFTAYQELSAAYKTKEAGVPVSRGLFDTQVRVEAPDAVVELEIDDSIRPLSPDGEPCFLEASPSILITSPSNNSARQRTISEQENITPRKRCASNAGVKVTPSSSCSMRSTFIVRGGNTPLPRSLSVSVTSCATGARSAIQSPNCNSSGPSFTSAFISTPQSTKRLQIDNEASECVPSERRAGFSVLNAMPFPSPNRNIRPSPTLKNPRLSIELENITPKKNEELSSKRLSPKRPLLVQSAEPYFKQPDVVQTPKKILRVSNLLNMITSPSTSNDWNVSPARSPSCNEPAAKISRPSAFVRNISLASPLSSPAKPSPRKKSTWL